MYLVVLVDEMLFFNILFNLFPESKISAWNIQPKECNNELIFDGYTKIVFYLPEGVVKVHTSH